MFFKIKTQEVLYLFSLILFVNSLALQNEAQKYIEELLGDIAQCLAEVRASEYLFHESHQSF